MPSDQRTSYGTPHHNTGHEQRSESGGRPVGTALTLVGIPVSWFASMVAAVIVLTYIMTPDASITVIPGLGRSATLWVAGSVLVCAGLAILVRPETVFWGWLIMGVLTAMAATFLLGWSTLLIIFEGLTIASLVPVYFFVLVKDAPDGFLAALALDRRLQ